jgi:hypothetical protein
MCRKTVFKIVVVVVVVVIVGEKQSICRVSGAIGYQMCDGRRRRIDWRVEPLSIVWRCRTSRQNVNTRERERERERARE